MPVRNPIYEEITADVLGKIGSWQWMITVIATLLMLLHVTTYCDDLFLVPYQGGHTCISPFNSTNITNPCNTNSADGKLVQCVEWKFLFLGSCRLRRTQFGFAIICLIENNSGTNIFQWLIYCQHKTQLLYVAIISRSGMIFGAIVFGLNADRFGRRKVIMISAICQLPLRLLKTFTSSSIWFRVLTFITSMFSVPTIFLGLIIVCEISSNKWRTSLLCICTLPYFLPMAASIPFARIIVYSEINALSVVVLNVILIFIVLRYLPESPQWLLFNNKNQKAESIISKAAQKNNILLCSDFKIRPVDYNAYETLDEETNYRRLLIKFNVMKILTTLTIIWLVGSFIWGQLFLLVYDGDEFPDTSFLPIITVIIICTWFVPMLYHKTFEHRFFLVTGMFSTGLLTLGLYYSQMVKSDWSDYLEIAAFATTSITISSMINLTPRLLAVNIRSTVTGFLMALGQVGTIISYIMHWYRVLNDVLFVSAIATATLVGVVSCFLLPRVEGRELPDVIGDMDTFGTTAKPLRWACQRTHSATQEEIELAVHSMENAAHYKDLPPPENTNENQTTSTRNRILKIFHK